jgi:hypothetical protein
MKILLGEINAKEGSDNVFKPRKGKIVYIRIAKIKLLEK